MPKHTEAQDFAASLRTKNKSKGADKLEVDPHFEEDPSAAKAIEYAIQRRKNAIIVGPTGCGKSSLVINIMARLKELGEIFSCDGETSTDMLIGKPWIVKDPKTGEGITVIAYGAALRAYKEGKGLLLEEVDVALPDILASLQRILEVQSKFYICNVGVEEIIPKHRNFFAIATANTIGTGEDTFMYAGTKPLNQAFMNRFGVRIKMGYIDRAHEIKILTNKTGIDKNMAMELVDVANDVRDAADPSRISGGTPGSQRLVSTISTRDLIEWADGIMGMQLAPEEAAKYAFLNCISETDADIIKTFISNRI